jgi:hypothetical protein
MRIASSESAAGVLVVELEVVVGLEQRGGETGVVVEIAVIAIHRALLAGDAVEGVGDAVELGARRVEAVESAEGQRGIEVPFDLAEVQHDGLRERHNAESGGQSSDRLRAQTTRHGFAWVH